MASNFYLLKCPECESEQKTFSRASEDVECRICGETLGRSTGGLLELNADLVKELEVE
jgi:small subunit ribosomal protein S27e